MAGIAKPNYDVKKEAMYKVIGGSVGIGSLNGLFDGTTPNDWQSAQVAYWNANGNYLEIEFFESVKLHRFYSWNNNNVQRLKILRHDGTGYNEDLTHLHLDVSTQAPLTWKQFTEVLPSGKYQFSLDTTDTGKTGRVDGEWYVESVFVNKTLILHDGGYKKIVLPQDYKTLIPKMTSDTTPSGTVSASSFYTSTNGNTANPYKAFNGTTLADNGWDGWCSTTNIGWIGYDFSTTTRISSYSISPLNFSTGDKRSPNSWMFEGKNNSQEWVVLDIRNNITDWELEKTRYFELDSVAEYSAYRLNVTKNNGDTYLAIGLLEMYYTPPYYKWNSLSQDIPTQEQFLSEGMDSLSPLLDRRVETLNPLPMTDKSEILSGGVDKIFVSKKIDLRKYFDIRNIKVEVK